MTLPAKALFAFNCNLDHLRLADDGDLKKIEAFSPSIYSQMDECFSWGVQREITIDARACEFFRSSIKFDRTLIGGQAGNAAEQASALGVKCLVHTNFAGSDLAGAFSHPENILLPSDRGFAPAKECADGKKGAHHFVFEHPESRTRFIASYDPVPLHIEDSFIRAIDSELPSVAHAFIGGLHLLQSRGRLQKFADEIMRWKEINPRLRTFCELGQFQNGDVRDASREIIFPAVDCIGLNDTEVASFGCGLDELASGAKTLFFHTPEHTLVLPREKEDEEALQFAEKCASFLAANGRHASLPEISQYGGGFVDSPVRTVGLGDTLSCAYFLSL